MSAQENQTPKMQRKILALHGNGSNKIITKLQLQNLELNDQDYDITYLNGTIQVKSPDIRLSELTGLVEGPWYSWLAPKSDWENLDHRALLQSICCAIESVLLAIEIHGPFDAIYGFSQGGYIASLVNNLPNDPALLDAVQSYMGRETQFSINSNIPFKTSIYACAGAAIPLSEMRKLAGLPECAEEYNQNQAIHLIGQHDALKPWSESLVLHDKNPNTQIFYLDSDHEISSTIAKPIKDEIKHCIAGISSASQRTESTEQASCKFSSRRIDTEVQVAHVSIHSEGQATTIIELLERRAQSSALFRLAREQNNQICTTYGDLLSFIRSGGEGDLRRVGVKSGQIVAYMAPSGGSAEGAVAFLTIAAQACAVPLSTTMTQAEALSALKQLQVEHVILFECVNAKNVIAACEEYCQSNNKSLHHVSLLSSQHPGLFKFKNCLDGYENQPELITQAHDDCLLLRTSGTTSMPKVVPLKQKDLVLNSTILADSIGINEFDVTYSVMPLDHIGGISASILASLSVGAAITCEGLYNPQLMAEALVQSNPKPTWYSAVPTIQLATLRYLHENREKYLDHDGVWSEHNLRLIRSGASALKEEDRLALIKTYDCPVLPTYSMSELMPISQPAQTEMSWAVKASSVGVPLIASLAIVDPVTLKPQPFGVAGEIAISGDTVFSGYKENPQANNKSRFLMPLPQSGEIRTWFLTGDLGQMDAFGHLSLEGRLKELIKRGGEQIAPAEIEDNLTSHSSIDIAICFPVPSETYGEEVGCAIVSSDPAFSLENQSKWVNELRSFLLKRGVSAHKIPSIWRVVDKNDLPMTNSKKYKRNIMAESLGITAQPSANQQNIATTSKRKEKKVATKNTSELALNMNRFDKPKVDWETIAGFRFILACYVMFMHIGANNSWEAFNNLRQFQWHVNSFFILAGFSLAILMPAIIQNKFAFIKARVAVMYPLYALAIIFAMGNLFVSCHSSTFIPSFSWGPLVHESTASYCQGTPWIEGSWLGNVILSFGIHATGLQATPLWGASWFIGFYLWFISMYFQCLVIFPMIYNALYKQRGNAKKIIMYIGIGLTTNVVILMGFWYGFVVDFVGYGLFDPETGLRSIPTAAQVAVAGQENAMGLGFYLFAPFWMVYFLVGMCAAFLYDAIRPTEQKRSHIWGYVADVITLIIICVSIAHITQGYTHFGPEVTQVPVDAYFMRPEAANSYADPSITNRIWDEIYSRSFAPLTLLWIFALSTGKGFTARLLRMSPFQFLAPTAYACFLFHQMVGQWYYAATRGGEWWNWWDYRKSFYWFSPEPVPVEWYEYFYVVGLVVIFAKLIQPVDTLLRNLVAMIIQRIKSVGSGTDDSRPVLDTAGVVLEAAEKISGLEVNRELSLNDNGLASLGIVRFVNALESEFSLPGKKVSFSMAEIMAAQDLNEVIAIVEKAILQPETLETNMILDDHYQHRGI
ncbi:AMP-dependent synthetase [Acinetobacter sp. AG1]|uniref:AMP-binding protein n=1 Tax=Acinetobacter TaxID=469 RepID=UPI00062980BF|nr:AMP-binding protein [Acinetobacter sp. AG1]KKW82035.1 AMP-dependent synthetase [Acinetobacter sp. AG1]